MRVGIIQLNWVSSAYCPNRDQFVFWRSESSALRVGVRHQPKAMEDLTAARGARAQRAGGVNSARWGNLRGGGRAGGRLTPQAKVTIGEEKPPRLNGDAVIFEDMREFLVACSEYEQQLYITNQDGGDRVLARRRELLGSATQMMAAD